MLLTEQLAGAADLQVVGREHESGAELLHRFDRLEPLGGVPGERPARWSNQVRVGAMVRAADPPAQLMQLCEPHVVGAIDHNGVGGRHVDAAFDDRRAQQQIEAPMIEVDHQVLEIPLAHLAVTDAHLGLGEQRLQLAGEFLDRAHFVVHEIYLPAAAQLAQTRLAQRRPVPFDDEGLDGEPLRGGRGDQRQIAQAAESHVERTGNGSGGQRQHVDVGAQRLHPLLVTHPEAMLLIDDEQAEILEACVRVKQSVRGDHDVDGAPLQALDRRLRLPGVTEA